MDFTEKAIEQLEAIRVEFTRKMVSHFASYTEANHKYTRLPDTNNLPVQWFLWPTRLRYMVL